MIQMTKSRTVRTEVVTTNGMVTAKHYTVAQIGVEILQRGGNAIDAAVAMAFAITVAEPRMSSIGGGGFMTVNLADGATFVVDYFACAPSGATPDMYELTPNFQADKLGFSGVKDNANAVGHRAVGIPGVVAGLLLAHEKWGALKRADVLDPAVRLAREGVPITFYDTLSSALGHSILQRNPEAARIYLNNGAPVLPGVDTLAYQRYPDLANTLEQIREGGADAFYTGDIAARIVDELARNNHPVTRADLANYRAIMREPLKTTYRDYELVLLPGASGGPTVAEIVHLLEAWDLKNLGQRNSEYVHLLIEACRLALADRLAWLGDTPDAPWREIASPEFARARRTAIGTRAAEKYVALNPRSGGYQPSAEHCTTFASAWDSAGNVVALTQTVTGHYGSGVVVPGTGILLNNAMLLFDPRPGNINSIAPGKRPLSSMAHVIVRREGKPIALAGAPGGRKIIDTVTQVMLNMLDFGMGPQDACASPFVDPAGPIILIDRDFGEDVITDLIARGHRLNAQEATIWPRLAGNPATITFDGTHLRGGVDPFTTGVAAGF